MPEELGIEHLKKAIHLAIALPIQIVKTIKTKFQLFDILAFVDEFRELTTVIKEKQLVVDEFENLSPAERKELFDFVKDEFDISDDKAEIFIENALTWVDSTLILIDEAKALKKK